MSPEGGGAAGVEADGFRKVVPAVSYVGHECGPVLRAEGEVPGVGGLVVPYSDLRGEDGDFGAVAVLAASGALAPCGLRELAAVHDVPSVGG